MDNTTHLEKAIVFAVTADGEATAGHPFGVETIDKLLLHTELDAKPLYEEAERIEMQLKSIHQQTEAAKKPSGPVRPSMYG